jgi:hypothetical protein
MAEHEVVRDVSPAELRDLLDHPPRASLAFTANGELELAPVAARVVEGRIFIAVAPDAKAPAEHGEAVLLIDDGWTWFELRGVSFRGSVAPVETAPAAGPPGATWFELIPHKTLAWDYGTLREASGACHAARRRR